MLSKLLAAQCGHEQQDIPNNFQSTGDPLLAPSPESGRRPVSLGCSPALQTLHLAGEAHDASSELAASISTVEPQPDYSEQGENSETLAGGGSHVRHTRGALPADGEQYVGWVRGVTTSTSNGFKA